MKAAQVRRELAKITKKREKLIAERDAIVQTYSVQLTALEQQRRSVVEQCPHSNMLYGVYNECGDCGEFF